MAKLNDLYGINIPEGAKQVAEEVEKNQNIEQNPLDEHMFDGVSELMDITRQVAEEAKKLKQFIRDTDSLLKNQNIEQNPLDRHMFDSVSDLKGINIPKELQHEPKVFKGEAPRDVRIPDEYEVVGSNAYCGDNSIGTVSMGNRIFVIRDGAFANCKNLKAVDMGDNVIEIDSSAFSGCKKLEAVYLSKNLRDINMNAFRDCSALEYMYLPENLTSIAAGAFANCTSLEKVVIPESVNYLGIGAFTDCKNLKEIDIPDALLAKMEREPVANIANVFKGTQLPIKKMQAQARAYEAKHRAAVARRPKNRDAEIEL